MNKVIDRVVLFDMDGCLIEPDGRSVGAYVGAFEQYIGNAAVSVDWNQYPARTDIEVARQVLSTHLGRPARSEEITAVLDTYLARVDTLLESADFRPQVVPGAKRFLSSLSGKSNIGLALVTGNLRNSSRLYLGRCGLWSFFGTGAYAEDGPNKETIVRVAIGRCHAKWPVTAEGSRFIVVGDQPTDLIAASSCDLPFVGIGSTNERHRALVEVGANTVFQDFRELESVLDVLDDLWNTFE